LFRFPKPFSGTQPGRPLAVRFRCFLLSLAVPFLPLFLFLRGPFAGGMLTREHVSQALFFILGIRMSFRPGVSLFLQLRWFYNFPRGSYSLVWEFLSFLILLVSSYHPFPLWLSQLLQMPEVAFFFLTYIAAVLWGLRPDISIVNSLWAGFEDFFWKFSAEFVDVLPLIISTELCSTLAVKEWRHCAKVFPFLRRVEFLLRFL